jgi:hypothetical protein
MTLRRMRGLTMPDKPRDPPQDRVSDADNVSQPCLATSEIGYGYFLVGAEGKLESKFVSL